MFKHSWFLLQANSPLKREVSLLRAYLFNEACQQGSMGNLFEFPGCVPVGSVEFVKAYAMIHGISLPFIESYPNALRQFCNREITKGIFGEVKDYQFVKPVHTKLFTGGIKSSIEEFISDDVEVFSCDQVSFTIEYRFYILGGKILGYGRYDCLDVDDKEVISLASWIKLQNLIADMIEEFKDAPIGYTLDVGLMDGKWSLVEVNDGWAIGFYNDRESMSIFDYAMLITFRWLEISCCNVS